ncbi:hypothetical protein KSP39_PZI005478 [Platanthera zijinensis]|uniref:Uncharacterized protein n=1 Tax=Platanthera zijinensis TaxID=2320716 RepID=A0AAP0BRN7_9ASPA
MQMKEKLLFAKAMEKILSESLQSRDDVDMGAKECRDLEWRTEKKPSGFGGRNSEAMCYIFREAKVNGSVSTGKSQREEDDRRCLRPPLLFKPSSRGTIERQPTPAGLCFSAFIVSPNSLVFSFLGYCFNLKSHILFLDHIE